MRQTTRVQLIATDRSFIEIQNHFQPQYFVHYLFEKIIINTVKSLNDICVGRGGIGLDRFICIGSSYDIHFGKNSFQCFLPYYAQGTPKCKNTEPLKHDCMASITYIEGLFIKLVCKLATYARRKCGGEWGKQGVRSAVPLI